MSPAQICKRLKDAFPGCIATICDINSACNIKGDNTFLCGSPKSARELLDFDKIKETHCRNIGRHTPKSVDALCANDAGTRLCFIEMKSWAMYFKYHPNSLSADIDAQTRKYARALPLKLEESIRLCMHYATGDSPLGTNIACILLTDIDVSTDTPALSNLADNLTLLAGTSTPLKTYANRATRHRLTTLSTPTLPHHSDQTPAFTFTTHYWRCTDLARNLSTLA